MRVRVSRSALALHTQAESEEGDGVRVDAVEDLFVTAFGPRPDLREALGSEEPVKAVLYPSGSVELESYLR